MATTTIDKEIEFSRLLDELSKLIFERDAALSSLAEVDQHLTALSTAIGITSSGLNTPAGLLCMLCPVTHLADVLGNGSTSSTNHLFEVTLRNDSTLPLLGNWNILLARLKPQESSVVHVAALPQIAAGAAWTGTVALDLSSSLTQDTVDLAVFLCFNGDSNTSISTVDTSSHRSASHIALLHIFRIDSLHSLQASSGGGSGSSSGLRNYYFSSGSQMMEIKLGVPKQFFGLDPDPQNVLNVLLKQGERSLCLPLTKQILNEKGSNNNDNNNSDISTTTTLVNGGIVQRRQHKAVVQGQLPQNHFTATDQNKSAAASVGSAASLSIQPAPFSLASSSSPHALLDLTCEAGNTVNCLKLHKNCCEGKQPRWRCRERWNRTLSWGARAFCMQFWCYTG